MKQLRRIYTKKNHNYERFNKHAHYTHSVKNVNKNIQRNYDQESNTYLKYVF